MAAAYETLMTETPEAVKQEVEWVPLSLALVEYPKGDLLGKFFAAISLLPLGVGCGFVTLILFRRDLHTIAFFVGVLLNDVLNIIYKNIICEPRPMYRPIVFGEHGMPSAHAQNTWFFTTYVIYFVFIRLHHMNNNTTLENVWKTLIVATCVTLATCVTIGRVYLQYHSWKQVLCGAALGFLHGTAWFSLVHILLTPYFPLIASWRASEVLLLRDTTLIPNILWFEYTNSRQETRARSRKLQSIKSQ